MENTTDAYDKFFAVYLAEYLAGNLRDGEAWAWIGACFSERECPRGSLRKTILQARRLSGLDPS